MFKHFGTFFNELHFTLEVPSRRNPCWHEKYKMPLCNLTWPLFNRGTFPHFDKVWPSSRKKAKKANKTWKPFILDVSPSSSWCYQRRRRSEHMCESAWRVPCTKVGMGSSQNSAHHPNIYQMKLEVCSVIPNKPVHGHPFPTVISYMAIMNRCV